MKGTLSELTALINTELRRVQYHHSGLLSAFLTRTRLDLTPLL
jgi:hypothetical protein